MADGGQSTPQQLQLQQQQQAAQQTQKVSDIIRSYRPAKVG